MAHIIGDVSTSSRAQIDKSLTVSGMAADAKVTGERIAELNEEMEHLIEHSENTNNPHNVTVKQLGLDRVDNTSDQEKPISTAQLDAITGVSVRADNAKKAADNAQASADDAKKAADVAHGVANDAMSEAKSAKSAAKDAQNYAYEVNSLARAKTAHKSVSVVLSTNGWVSKSQNVAVEDVDAEKDIFVSPNPIYYETYINSGIYCSAQGAGTLTFKCKEVPTTAIEVNIAILTGSGVFSDAQLEDELLGGES